MHTSGVGFVGAGGAYDEDEEWLMGAFMGCAYLQYVLCPDSLAQVRIMLTPPHNAAPRHVPSVRVHVCTCV